MNQLQKYTWLIETIRRSGRISFRELSDRWERRKDLSDCRRLPRATFNRWREAILRQFGIEIACSKTGAHKYYIENPEAIDEDKLKKWMLDSYATGNLFLEHIEIKERILLDEIPSGREFLTTILEAMQQNRTLVMSYRPFKKINSYQFPIEPYCVRLFENRWYIIAHNIRYDDIRIYSLDRIERLETIADTFSMPEDFNAQDFFHHAYGIVIDKKIPPERIIIRANKDHKQYIKTLPLHHSQKLLAEVKDHADFELFLSPTYDFIMKLLQVGAMVEVIHPHSLRQTMKAWISDMHQIYNER